MTPINFAKYIRLKTKTNATTFPDADIITYANIIKDDLAKEITRANEDYFGIEMTKDLVANKRGYGFPTYILNQIKYVQAKLDGTNWKKLSEFDITGYQKTTDEASILANWAGKEPMFDIMGGQMFIYNDSAITDVEEGLKLWAIIYPEDITSLAGSTDLSISSSNTSFGIPRQLHYVWAEKVVIEYKTSKEKPIPLTEREQNINIEMEQAINSLKLQNLDRVLIANIPDKSNNGQDY
jgi:hypothetical protein